MRTYELRGRVIRGEGWGRKLGYPTANLDHDYFRFHPIPPGVYAAFVTVGKRHYRAIAIIGVPFTWQPKRTKLELHLLRFSGRLVGRMMHARLIRRIRLVKQFPNVPTMLKTIKADIVAANRSLSGHGQPKTTRRG